MNSSPGSIRKRKTKNGYVWQITIELPPDPFTQKRVRKYRTVKGTKKEAEKIMYEMVTEIEKGCYVPDQKITVKEWIDKWMEVYAIPNLSPTTLCGYEGMIRRYINPLLGNMQVQELTTLAVQAWVNRIKISPSTGNELSAATVKHVYHVLKGAMDKAVLAGIILRSPCVGITLPKGRKKAAIIYDEDEIKRLIQVAKGTPMELVIDFELCLGLRRGELLGLQWKDIDWKNRQIHICRSRTVAKGKSIVKTPKTAAGYRTLDVPEKLIQKLFHYRTHCMENAIRFGRKYTESDFVIIHYDGKPIYPEYLSQLLTKLQIKANLPQCRFHDLRHLCASIMLKQGIDVKTAQQILGHADASTTLNIYTHVLPSSAKAAAEKIGELVYQDEVS